MQAISSIGIFVSVLYVILLIKKKQKSFPDKVLLVWMMIFAIHLVLPFMISIGNQFFIEKVNGLDLGLTTLHITLLYYYSLSVTNNITRFQYAHLLYLIPTIFIYIFQGILDSNVKLFEDFIELYLFNNKQLFHLVGVVFLNLVFCLYFCEKLFKILSDHRKNIENNLSYNKDVDLIWLKNLAIIPLVLTVIAVFFLYGLFKGILNRTTLDYIYFSFFSVFAVMQGYWGVKQKHILVFDIENTNTSADKLKEATSKKAENCKPVNELEPTQNKETKLLLDFMSNEKPFLDPELSIGTLSNKLGLHPHQLSKNINRHFNKNFFEFINEYRIEEFKKLAVDPKNKHISILGLAMDAGFNSKATFNRIFKNASGLTPSQFRESYKF